MRLYNTASRKLDELPAPPGPIRMYFCGPTVYQRIHVGNARPFVVSMWLKRWPEHESKATETIPEIVALIEELIERGLAYPAGGDVYYRVERYPDYGVLSGRLDEDSVRNPSEEEE